MTAEELRRRLDQPERPVLLHVLPPEVFDAARIPGSVNACVYEVAFLDAVKELVPDMASPIVVYGAGGGSQDAGRACESLRSAGFSAVGMFKGGLDEWVASGLPVEGTGRLPGESPAPADGDYRVDADESVIRWTGRNLFNHHSGTVRLSGGQIQIGRGKLVDACFRIDLQTIACEDIGDSAMNRLLVRHLHSGDFFDVERFPEAVFLAESSEPIPGASPGQPNFLMKGEFSLRGVSRPLAFPVVVAQSEPGRLVGQAQVAIDRTDFGSVYGSGRFFRFLGQHVVNDTIDLHVKIHAAQ